MGDFQKIHRYFSPLLSILTDKSVNELLGDTNSINSLSELLSPFDVLHNVPLRTSQLETHHAPSFHLRFNELAELDNSTEELHNVVEKSAGDATVSTNSDKIYETFLSGILNHHALVPYCTFQHPVAFILATTTKHADPVSELARLAQEVSFPDAYAKRAYMNATPNYVLRYYVLVHDANDGDMDHARNLLEKAKRAHGIHCALLIINSKHSKEEKEVDETVTKTYGHSRAHSLDASDLTVIRAFVRELVVQSLIPWMEKCARDWNQLFVTNRKGFTNKLFSSFGVSRKWAAQQAPARAINSGAPVASFVSSEKIYPSTTHEATFRRLADFAFMIRDYKLSAQVYNQLRRDTEEEPEAYLYMASANKMLGLSHLLSPHSPTSTLDTTVQYLDEASLTWFTTKNATDRAQMLRATLLYIESFRARGSSGLVIPSSFIKAASTGNGLSSAIMLEQAANAYKNHMKPYKRKACLYFAQAATVYESHGKHALARRCYESCDTDRFPFINQALGRLANGEDAPILITKSLRYGGDQRLLDDWRDCLRKDENAKVTFPLEVFDKGMTYIRDPHAHVYTNRKSERIFDTLEKELKASSEKVDDRIDIDIDEVFHVVLVARNPFNAGILLNNFQLEFEGEANIECLNKELELGALETNEIVFKCSVSSASTVKLNKVEFTIDNVCKVTESLQRNGARLNDTKEHRMGRFYAPDLSLEVRVNEPTPRLVTNLERFPQRMGLGEGYLAHIDIQNVGKVDVDDIRVVVNEQSFVVLGVDENISTAQDVYKQSLETSTEQLRIENNLRSSAPYAIGKDLKSGDTHTIPVLLRGDNVGKKALHLIVVYKQKNHENHRKVNRLLHVIDIRPVVEVKLAAQPSKMQIGSYDLSLEIENVVPDSQIEITQVSFVSPAWKCIGEMKDMNLAFEDIAKQEFKVEFTEDFNAEDSLQTQTYMVDKMAEYLQGDDITENYPPPINVISSHLTHDKKYIPMSQAGLFHMMMSARRYLRQMTFSYEFKSIPWNVQSHLFPLFEANEGDVVVCWKMGDRVGHALVSGLVLGAREGLTRRIGEKVKQSKNIKSVMYASKVREREKALSELTKSRYSVYDMPIIVNTYTPSPINHDFEQNPELRISVDVSLFNNSIYRNVESKLQLRDEIEGMVVPVRDFTADVSAHDTVNVNIALDMRKAGRYKLKQLLLTIDGLNYVVNLNEIVLL